MLLCNAYICIVPSVDNRILLTCPESNARSAWAFFRPWLPTHYDGLDKEFSTMYARKYLCTAILFDLKLPA